MAMNTIPVSDIKYVLAREINWGADFDALEDKQKIVYLKKFSASMNQAAELIQGERNALANDIEVMKKMMQAAETATNNHKSMLTKVITDNNLAAQAAGNEITLLKRELAKMAEVCHGDND